jgi:hypothetical protein
MSVSKSAVREMVSEVIEFTRGYVVWRELMDRGNRDVREEHPDFLLTVTNSFVQGFCVSTYQLFDRDSRTKSLSRLIGDLRSSDAALAQHLQSKITAQQAALQKLFRIRCNVYAHRNRSLGPEALFATVGLTPRQMRAVVDLAQDTVSDLGVASGLGAKDELERQFQSHEQWVLDDTRRVLRALRKD